MEWKDVANAVGKFAPEVGTLLGGPAGAAVGSLVSAALGVGNSPDVVSQALATDPDAAVKLAQIKADNDVELKKLLFAHADNALAADTARIQAVNATMQDEAKSDHWLTYSWRPMTGMAVAFNVFASSVLVLVAYVGPMVMTGVPANLLIQLPSILGSLAALNATVLPILGIASYFRGKMQADPTVATDNRG